MGDLPEPKSLYTSESAVDMPALLPSTTTATQSLISNERWSHAENETRQIIYKVLPTDVSGKTRREIIVFLSGLIRTRTGCEVFPYGSVPLKTYLPDGDIDLTAICSALSEDYLADQIVSLLENCEQNEVNVFRVKDVQLIRAEVKIIKCIVQNVVVDISLNQIGGLCTLCFLEQVNRVIGKNHLFKRSIVLIKTWCYYESRILGAPHGLISTYALEIMVLYIFNLFHSSLDGPLAVLYRFLDHLSKFDWENNAVSLNGPVRLASLPELKAETPGNGGINLLLSSEFVENCLKIYSVPSRGNDLSLRAFNIKHLNIIDPLKENNNLGRSVSKGNFYRIKSAFSYGARQLGSILMDQELDLNEELSKFFSNTLERHGCRLRPDSPGPYMLLSDTEPSSQNVSIPENVCSSTRIESSSCGIKDKSTCSLDRSSDLETVPNLAGEYEYHLHCLYYSRMCFQNAAASKALITMPVAPPPPPPLFPYNHRRPWVAVHCYTNDLRSRPRPPFYPINPRLVVPPGMRFGSEDIRRPRGTGTYFPNPIRVGQVVGRPPSMKYISSPRTPGIGRCGVFMSQNTRAQSMDTVNRLSWIRIGPTNNHHVNSPHANVHSISNGLVVHSEGNLVSVSNQTLPILEISNQTLPISEISNQTLPILERNDHGQGQGQDLTTEIPKLISNLNQISLTDQVQIPPKTADTEEDDRISKKSSYRLKDNEDFPPL